MIDWLGRPQGWLRWLLSLFGIIVITWSMTALFIRQQIPLWVFVTVLVANLAWLLLTVIPTAGIPTAVIPGSRIPVSGLLACVMVAAGGVTAAAVDGIAIVPAAVGVLWVVRDIRQPFARGVQLGIAGMLVVLVGDLLEPSCSPRCRRNRGRAHRRVPGGTESPPVRARRSAEPRTGRGAGAHGRTGGTQPSSAADIHDVLAHSLGGLVIQLDAVDALLESGDTDVGGGKGAATPARSPPRGWARPAARSRRCRSPPASVTVGRRRARSWPTWSPLVDAHRSLGGRARFIAVWRTRAASVLRSRSRCAARSRRDSPTRASTRRGSPSRWRCAGDAGSVQLHDLQPAGCRPGRDRRAATAWSGCASGSQALPGGVGDLPRQTPTSFVVTAEGADRVSELIRVIVVDDQAIVREGLVTVLSLLPDIEVLGEAADGRAAVELVDRLVPDVVLMDLRMPVLGGLEATRRDPLGASGGRGAHPHDLRRRGIRGRCAAGGREGLPHEGCGPSRGRRGGARGRAGAHDARGRGRPEAGGRHARRLLPRLPGLPDRSRTVSA